MEIGAFVVLAKTMDGVSIKKLIIKKYGIDVIFIYYLICGN